MITHDSNTGFQRCKIRGAATGVFCSGTDDSVKVQGTRATFTDCDVRGASSTGVHFDGVTASRVVGTTIAECRHYSVVFAGTSHGILRSSVVIGPAPVRVMATAHPGLCDNIVVGAAVIMENSALAVTGFVSKLTAPPVVKKKEKSAE